MFHNFGKGGISDDDVLSTASTTCASQKYSNRSILPLEDNIRKNSTNYVPFEHTFGRHCVNLAEAKSRVLQDVGNLNGGSFSTDAPAGAKPRSTKTAREITLLNGHLVMPSEKMNPQTPVQEMFAEPDFSAPVLSPQPDYVAPVLNYHFQAQSEIDRAHSELSSPAPYLAWKNKCGISPNRSSPRRESSEDSVQSQAQSLEQINNWCQIAESHTAGSSNDIPAYQEEYDFYCEDSFMSVSKMSTIAPMPELERSTYAMQQEDRQEHSHQGDKCSGNAKCAQISIRNIDKNSSAAFSDCHSEFSQRQRSLPVLEAFSVLQPEDYRLGSEGFFRDSSRSNIGSAVHNTVDFHNQSARKIDDGLCETKSERGKQKDIHTPRDRIDENNLGSLPGIIQHRMDRIREEIGPCPDDYWMQLLRVEDGVFSQMELKDYGWVSGRGKICKILYDWVSSSMCELSLKANDIVDISFLDSPKLKEDWWFGIVIGQRQTRNWKLPEELTELRKHAGYFPACCARLSKHGPSFAENVVKNMNSDPLNRMYPGSSTCSSPSCCSPGSRHGSSISQYDFSGLPEWKDCVVVHPRSEKIASPLPLESVFGEDASHQQRAVCNDQNPSNTQFPERVGDSTARIVDSMLEGSRWLHNLSDRVIKDAWLNANALICAEPVPAETVFDDISGNSALVSSELLEHLQPFQQSRVFGDGADLEINLNPLLPLRKMHRKAKSEQAFHLNGANYPQSQCLSIPNERIIHLKKDSESMNLLADGTSSPLVHSPLRNFSASVSPMQPMCDVPLWALPAAQFEGTGSISFAPNEEPLYPAPSAEQSPDYAHAFSRSLHLVAPTKDSGESEKARRAHARRIAFLQQEAVQVEKDRHFQFVDSSAPPVPNSDTKQETCRTGPETEELRKATPPMSSRVDNRPGKEFSNRSDACLLKDFKLQEEKEWISRLAGINQRIASRNQARKTESTISTLSASSDCSLSGLSISESNSAKGEDQAASAPPTAAQLSTMGQMRLNKAAEMDPRGHPSLTGPEQAGVDPAVGQAANDKVHEWISKSSPSLREHKTTSPHDTLQLPAGDDNDELPKPPVPAAVAVSPFPLLGTTARLVMP